MMIGILDSGIGGLTVARAVSERMAGYDLFFFGDTARAPYGTKGPETVRRFALQGARYLKSRGIGLLVIASHTISALCAGALAEQLDMPLIDAVLPAAKQALRETRKARIGVLGSPTLTATRIYERHLKAMRPDVQVVESSCALLAALIEAGWSKRPETAGIIKKCLRPLKDYQVDTLIPACSHFTVLQKPLQQKAGQRVRVVSPGHAQARALEDYLAIHPEIDGCLTRNGRLRFEVSDLAGLPPRLVNTLFGRRLAIAQAPAANGL
jgi:glutamate racemase